MLAFKWKAIYNDDSEFNQYEGEVENLFGNIKMENLKELHLISDGKTFKADFANRKLYEDDVELVSECSGNLVYFRRNRVINVPNTATENYTEFHLGIGDKKLVIKKDGTYTKIGF